MEKIKSMLQTSTGCKILCQQAIKWDSYYCGLFGLISLVLNSQLNQIMSFNRYIFIGTGVAVLGWAALLYYQHKNMANIVPFTKFVAYANCAAGLGVMGLSILDMTIYGRILSVLVGIEVIAFGATQLYFLKQESKNREDREV